MVVTAIASVMITPITPMVVAAIASMIIAMMIASVTSAITTFPMISIVVINYGRIINGRTIINHRRLNVILRLWFIINHRRCRSHIHTRSKYTNCKSSKKPTPATS
jgi:hypothetical protein